MDPNPASQARRPPPEGDASPPPDPDRQGGPAPRTVFSRPMVWFLAGLAVVFDAVLYLPLTQGWEPVQAAVVALCAVIAFGLVLTAIDAERFPWGMRVVTGALFAVLFLHFAAQALGPRTDRPALLLAIAGLCLVGLPALAHTLWGSTYGPPDEDAVEVAARGDLITHLLLALTTLAGLVVLGMLAGRSMAALWRLVAGG